MQNNLQSSSRQSVRPLINSSYSSSQNRPYQAESIISPRYNNNLKQVNNSMLHDDTKLLYQHGDHNNLIRKLDLAVDEINKNHDIIRCQDEQIISLSKTLEVKDQTNNTLENKIIKKNEDTKNYLLETQKFEENLEECKDNNNKKQDELKGDFSKRNDYLTSKTNRFSQQVLNLEDEMLQHLVEAKNNIMNLQQEHSKNVEILNKFQADKIVNNNHEQLKKEYNYKHLINEQANKISLCIKQNEDKINLKSNAKKDIHNNVEKENQLKAVVNENLFELEKLRNNKLEKEYDHQLKSNEFQKNKNEQINSFTNKKKNFEETIKNLENILCRQQGNCRETILSLNNEKMGLENKQTRNKYEQKIQEASLTKTTDVNKSNCHFLVAINDQLEKNVSELGEAKDWQNNNHINDLSKLNENTEELQNQKATTIAQLDNNITKYNNEIGKNLDEVKYLNEERNSMNFFISERKQL